MSYRCQLVSRGDTKRAEIRSEIRSVSEAKVCKRDEIRSAALVTIRYNLGLACAAHSVTIKVREGNEPLNPATGGNMRERTEWTDRARLIEAAATEALDAVAAGSHGWSAVVGGLPVAFPATTLGNGSRCEARPVYLRTEDGALHRASLGRGTPLFDGAIVEGGRGVPFDVKAASRGGEIRLTADLRLARAVMAANFDYGIVEVDADVSRANLDDDCDVDGDVFVVQGLRFRVASGLAALRGAQLVDHEGARDGARLRTWVHRLSWSPWMGAAQCRAYLLRAFAGVSLPRVEKAVAKAETSFGAVVRVYAGGRVTVQAPGAAPQAARPLSLTRVPLGILTALVEADGGTVREPRRMQVSRIREALTGACPGDWLPSIRGKGYRLG